MRFSLALIEMGRPVTRFRAFGVHVAISTCVAVLFALLVFLLWYPAPLAQASGVQDIFVLILLVDVALGPLITLVIFNPKKKELKELKRDLAIVAALQLGALLYGLHTVYVARPVYIVFAKDRFDLVFANDLTEERLAEARWGDYRRLPKLGPELVAVRPPDNVEEQSALLFASLSGGPDLQHMPKYYVPYPELQNDVVKRVQPLNRLKELNQGKPEIVDVLLSKYSSAKTEAGFLPLKGKSQDLVVVVDRATGKVLETLDLAPWK